MISVAWITLAFLGIPLTPLLVFVAGPMRRAEYYGLAMTASIQLLIPIYPLWFVGLPIGIWSLTMLGQQDVRKAFREVQKNPYR